MPEPYKRKGSRKYHGAFRHPGTGKRVVVPLFSDKQASRAELDRRIKQAEREAAGLVDPSDAERRRPLDEHIDEYEAACRHAGESRVHVNNKTSQLRRLAAHAGATRLGDLTAKSHRADLLLWHAARDDQAEGGEVFLAVDAAVHDLDCAVTRQRRLGSLPPRPELQDEDDDDGEDDGPDDDLAGSAASKKAQHGRDS